MRKAGGGGGGGEDLQIEEGYEGGVLGPFCSKGSQTKRELATGRERKGGKEKGKTRSSSCFLLPREGKGEPVTGGI